MEARLIALHIFYDLVSKYYVSKYLDQATAVDAYESGLKGQATVLGVNVDYYSKIEDIISAVAEQGA